MSEAAKATIAGLLVGGLLVTLGFLLGFVAMRIGRDDQ